MADLKETEDTPLDEDVKDLVDEQDDEDERPHSGEDVNPDDPDDHEREAIRERRRLEKVERRERREKAIIRDKTELEFLRKRNEDLERRITGVEQHTFQTSLSQLDANIAQARREADMAERVIAKAVEAGNGSDVTQAMRYRDQAFQRIQQLSTVKQQASPPKPTATLDERTAHYAREFLKENTWYDQSGKSEESAIVLAIDQNLAREGFRSDTEEYWQELRTRAARRLPERFKPVSGERTPRGGPAVGSGKEHAPASTRQEIMVSPDRKQAMIDAGVWDDPTLRARYIKRYAEYDRQHKS